MADYIITTKRFGPNDYDTVLSELETYLESIDDTNQPVLNGPQFVHTGGSDVVCLLVHEDTA